MDSRESSPAIARAGELDADGRHDDAINELARAAQRNEVEATTELAKRIIVGDRAPRLTRQGIGLLQDAVNLGGAEAAERMAVISVCGLAAQPDWPSALRLLTLAAERGSVSALRQLEVLATMGCTAPATDIDLRALLIPGAGTVLHADPRICTFPAFVGTRICDWLIERARTRLERALVYDVVKQTDFADQSRTNSSATFHLMDADLVHLMVQTRIAAACGQPVSHLEAPTVLHYAVGETIGNHYDFVDPAHPGYVAEISRRGTRIITFLVYLNANYAGGHTVFPKLDLEHPGQPGEGMYFVNTLADGQADVRTLHNGQPPTRGEKWVFSQFVRNRKESLND